MSERREWHNDDIHDKASWGPGPWHDEPDKIQWVDEETGLDCLIVRNHGGALCGYVGVPDGHPAYGVGYSDESEKLGAAFEARKQRPVGENPGLGVMLSLLTGDVKASPEIVFEVHGGLTFSDTCHEPTREQYDSIADQIARLVPKAEEYPNGDAARSLDRLVTESTLTFEEWVVDQQGKRVCHVPEPGRHRDVFWFGFDTAHAGDYSPGHEARMKQLMPDLPRGPRGIMGDTYRDVAYVENEVRSLARQLAAVAAPAQ